MKDLLLSVIKNEKLNENTFSLTLKSEEKLPPINAGQFVNISTPDKSLILRRPFCIYDSDEYTIKLCIAIVGKGTLSLSKLEIGQRIKALLPLGNGFNIANYKRIALLGGGMGIAALHKISKESDKEFYAYFGFSNGQKVLFEQDFSKIKKLVVCTDDGSYKVKGYPINELKKDIDLFDAILICGPSPMVKNAKDSLKDVNIPVFVSLEQHMGCGIGACVVCACKINNQNKRVCLDGPVFNLKEVDL